MQTMGNARDHFWRVIKMAKACEVDLSTALDEGQIDIDGYANMITDCRKCAKVDHCDKLLADLNPLDTAPDYCRNKSIFARLRES